MTGRRPPPPRAATPEVPQPAWLALRAFSLLRRERRRAPANPKQHTAAAATKHYTSRPYTDSPAALLMNAFVAKNAKTPANDENGASSAQSLDAVRDILFGAQTRDIQGRIEDNTRRLDARLTEAETLTRDQLQGLRTHTDGSLSEQQRLFAAQIQILRDELQAFAARSAADLLDAERRMTDALATFRSSYDQASRNSSARAAATAEALRNAALALERAGE